MSGYKELREAQLRELAAEAADKSKVAELLWDDDIFYGSRPIIDFVLPGMPAGTTALLVGPGGVSKSFLALQTAVSIGLGSDIYSLWTDGEFMTPGRVVVLNLEDITEMLRLRMYDIVHYDGRPLDYDEYRTLRETVSIMPLYGCGFSFGTRNPKTGRIEPTLWFDRLVEFLKNARLVIVDTFNRSLAGLDENSSSDVGGVLSIVERICREVGCAFLIIHHVNKNSMKKGEQQSQSAARGSAALTDNARWQTNLATMDDKVAEELGLAEGEHRRWVEVDLTKVNYGPPVGSRWLKRCAGGVLDGREQPAGRAYQNV